MTRSAPGQRALAAAGGLLALLLALAGPTLVGRAADPVLLSESFETGFEAWRIIERGDGRVIRSGRAAQEGEYGARLSASAEASAAGLAKRFPSPLADVSVAFSVRLRGGHVLASLSDANGVAARLLRSSAGRLALRTRAGLAESSVRLPLGEWRRLVLDADAGSGRVRLSLAGTTILAVRGAIGQPLVSLRLAGAVAAVALDLDRVVVRSATLFEPVPEPIPSPDPTPAPEPTDSRFAGRGTDHGVGLSQWGAIGRAAAGQSAAEILAHYYPGTTLGTRADRPLRVMVVDAFVATSANPGVVCGRRTAWSVEGDGTAWPAGACLHLRPGSGGWKLEIRDAYGSLLASRAWDGDVRLQPTAGATRFEVLMRESTRDTYRGAIRVVRRGGALAVVNELPLELYLRGVVPAEIAASSPAAALEAQAIAARGYALVHLRPDHPLFDIFDDGRHQAYGGVAVERVASTAAVQATAGLVVLYSGRPANTLYHSVGGGATEDAQNVWTTADGSLGTDVPYLRGSLDVDATGRSYDADGPYQAWRTRTFTLAALGRIMANDPRTAVGTLQSLGLSRRGVSGRLISVRLVGSERTVRVAGWVFKAVFNTYRGWGGPLNSTLFFLEPAP